MCTEANKMSLFVSTGAVPKFFNFTDGQHEYRETYNIQVTILSQIFCRV